MKYMRSYYKFPLIIFFSLFLINFGFILKAVFATYQYNRIGLEERLSYSEILNFKVLIVPALLLLYAFVYLKLKNRYINIVFVNAHVWLVITVLFFFPILSSVFFGENFEYFSPYKHKESMLLFSKIYAGLWILFSVLANIFFILVILKSSILPKDKIQINESAGFLNEFTD
jgi:hypothetical protein